MSPENVAMLLIVCGLVSLQVPQFSVVYNHFDKLVELLKRICETVTLTRL